MAASLALERIHEEETVLREKLGSRGCNRAAIVRKEAQRQMRKLKRKEKQLLVSPKSGGDSDDDNEEGEHDGAEHGVSWSGRSGSFSIVAELHLPADPALFLPSAQTAHWRRDQAADYHLALLRRADNPLSRRVAAWEDLDEQPAEYEPVATGGRHEAWRQRARRSADGEAVYGDEAMFRDLVSLAEQMDCHSKLETCYRLSDGKPTPFEPDFAASIVLYRDPGSLRVSGALVYDSLGQARVDVNFKHHCKQYGKYQVLSGHWHVLAVGSHAHESGLENHYDYRLCPWIWQAIPREFAVIPSVPVGQ